MTVAATSSVVAPPAAHLGVQQIPLDQLKPSPNNPRKTVGDLKELAESIRQSGIQVPLTVRRSRMKADASDYEYEIVAGHRRYFSAELLGTPSIPCIVRDLTDNEAQEIALIDNLQREDLGALDEADAYAGLLETSGSVSAIAAKTGKPIEHVTRVLKLRTLIPFSREALSAKLLTVDHALLLCKLAAAEQEKALRFALQPDAPRKDKTADIVARCIKDRGDNLDGLGAGRRWHGGYWQPQSVLNLKSFIEREIKLELKRAPWDLADASLVPAAGACSACPKNTAANAALFGDLAIEHAVCTDAACFQAKRDAFVQIQLKAVAEAGKDAVRISWKFTSSKPRALDDSGSDRYLGQVFKAGQWIEAKKGSCANVKTGVTVDFEESAYGSIDAKKKPGMKLLVCATPACKAHKKEWEKPAQRVDHNGNSEENRKKSEERAAAVNAENEIRAQFVKKAIAGVTKLSGELLRTLILHFVPRWLDADDQRMFPGLEKGLKTLKVESAEFARAAVCLLFVGRKRAGFLDHWDKPEDGRKEFIALMKVLGVDASKAWAAPAPLPAPPKNAAAKKSAPAKKKPAKKAAKKGGRK